MKKILSPFLILFVVCTTNAQDANILPRADFEIQISTKSIRVNTGESASVDVNILRSKPFKKSHATIGVSSDLPEGVEVHFQSEEPLERSRVTFTASRVAKPGEYTIIIKGTLQNQTKGVALRLIITGDSNPAISER